MNRIHGDRVAFRFWPERLRTYCEPHWKSVLACSCVLALAVAATMILGGHLREKDPELSGKPISAWLLDASSTNAAVRSRAESVLRENCEQALPILIRFIRSRSLFTPRLYARLESILPHGGLGIVPSPWLIQDKRMKACAALAAIGPAANSAIPALAKYLTDQDHEVVSAACQALALISPASVPFLSQALTNSATTHTFLAADALRRLGTNALPALPALREAMRLGDSLTVLTVIRALGVLGAPAVPILVERLKNPIGPHRKEVIEILASLGTNAQLALPTLKSLDQDPDYPWNRLAGLAFQAIETGKPMKW